MFWQYLEIPCCEKNVKPEFPAQPRKSDREATSTNAEVADPARLRVLHLRPIFFCARIEPMAFFEAGNA
jgi:hypothetical protein